MASKQAATERESMKISQIITLIVGITAMAFTPITWAAGHGGGGGGFGGGGFGGGGHFGGGGGHFGGTQGGGFRGGGVVTGGVGSRGGGVGFGAMRPSYGVPNFAGAGSRFSSFGRPSSRQPVYDGRPTRSMTQSGRITAPSQQQNRFASGASREQGARPESQGSWLSAFPALANTSPHSMMRTGTTIGTGGMFILTMAASLYLSVGFGAD